MWFPRPYILRGAHEPGSYRGVKTNVFYETKSIIKQVAWGKA